MAPAAVSSSRSTRRGTIPWRAGRWMAPSPAMAPARTNTGQVWGRPSEALTSRPAEQASYTDAKSGQVVYAYHARLTGLRSSHDYVYVAVHDGAQPELGSFRTGPRGRERFIF